MSEESSKLCQSCSMCCNGVLFGHVTVAKEEEDQARSTGLILYQVKDSMAFYQACSALKQGCCTIYDKRPTKCRNYRCNLLRAVEDEGFPLDRATRIIARLRRLVDSIEREIGELKPGESLDRRFRRFARAQNLTKRQLLDNFGQLFVNYAALKVQIKKYFNSEALLP